VLRCRPTTATRRSLTEPSALLCDTEMTSECKVLTNGGGRRCQFPRSMPHDSPRNSQAQDVLAAIARERALHVIVDGTNADDLNDHRPGARAAQEHGVRSPLAELGFTKAATRRLSKARGSETWSQPSSPCRSSRIPYGTQVTAARLRQIEHAEANVRGIGVSGDLRVRTGCFRL
jgi:hypothetical protein